MSNRSFLQLAIIDAILFFAIFILNRFNVGMSAVNTGSAKFALAILGFFLLGILGILLIIKLTPKLIQFASRNESKVVNSNILNTAETNIVDKHSANHDLRNIVLIIGVSALAITLFITFMIVMIGLGSGNSM